MNGLIKKFFTGSFFSVLIIIWIFQVSTTNDPSLLNEGDYVFNVSKNVLTGMISIIGISVAYEGLNTWRLQLSGRHNYDLANRALNILSKLNNAYINLSTMWLFTYNDATTIQTIHLGLFNFYWKHLDELRSSVNNLATLQDEITASWIDFPFDSFLKMSVKASSYLRKAELFLGICDFERPERESIKINLSSNSESMTKRFTELCSDKLLNVEKNKGIHSTVFQKDYKEFKEHYRVVLTYLLVKIRIQVSGYF